MVRNTTKPSELNTLMAFRLAIVLFLLFPFLFLLFQFRPQTHVDMGEFFWALKNSTYQAALSAVFSLFLGFWAALGLLTLGPRHSKIRLFAEILCLGPNFIPTLFILLAVLNILQPFPVGILGIVIVHTIINFGFVAVLLARQMEERVGAYAELAYVEGCGKLFFLKSVVLPLMRKDLLSAMLFVFVICFGSFSVPLIVGGGRGTTVEVLIYEKIRLSQQWGEAVFLAFAQSLFIFALSVAIARGSVLGQGTRARMTLLKTFSGVFVIGFFSVFLLTGYLSGLSEGWEQWAFLKGFENEIIQGALGSLGIGLLAGAFTLCLLLVLAYVLPHAGLQLFMRGYVAPSTALACFSFLILGPNDAYWPFVKIPVVFVMLSLNGLYRMGWETKLEHLRQQIQVASVMGASRQLIFTDILLPQILPHAGFLAGIASVWATGDFAISRILAHKDISLGMMTETLMSTYRLNQASVLSLFVLLAGLFCFIFFHWGSRVFSRKSLL